MKYVWPPLQEAGMKALFSVSQQTNAVISSGGDEASGKKGSGSQRHSTVPGRLPCGNPPEI